ncbi:hypothetical protein SBV1_260008 [Verrucomicrobia bacterium]|nr:hypothetical protein SBV1_260008 [Verrucomicrobiota bacterium]
MMNARTYPEKAAGALAAVILWLTAV